MSSAARSFSAIFWLLAAIPAIAADASDADAPTVSSVWSRPALEGRTGVVYMTIQGARRDDRLIGVTTDAAQNAQLHVSTEERGVARMRSVESIPVPAGESVRLSPGGYHVMLPDLKRALHPGDSFPVTLTFQEAGQVDATAVVRKGEGAMDERMRMPMDHP